jgi:predicted RNA-binding protein with PIN domain
MHLLIDGYNLLYVGRSMISTNPIELQGKRDRLIDQLSAYRSIKGWGITAVFDGWQGGWSTEKRERKKGIEVIYSKLGERADEVIKRLVQEKGAGVTVVTSDRDVSRYAERMAVAVIPSDQFKEKMERAFVNPRQKMEEDEEEGRGSKKKGPSRRLSKRERRRKAALNKL